MTVRYDIKNDEVVRRGTRRSVSVNVTDDGTSSGSPVDITGWTIEYAIRKARTENDVDAAVISGAASVVDGPNGQAAFTLTYANTMLLFEHENPYWYDVKRTDSGNEEVLVEGELYTQDGGVR